MNTQRGWFRYDVLMRGRSRGAERRATALQVHLNITMFCCERSISTRYGVIERCQSGFVAARRLDGAEKAETILLVTSIQFVVCFGRFS